VELLSRAAGPLRHHPKEFCFLLTDAREAGKKKLSFPLAGARLSGKAPEFFTRPRGASMPSGGQRQARSHGDRRLEAESRRNAETKRPFIPGQVSPIACQLGPGLGATGPPPAIVFPFISQIEAWPLVF
jgi:hypothetical protein